MLWRRASISRSSAGSTLSISSTVMSAGRFLARTTPWPLQPGKAAKAFLAQREDFEGAAPMLLDPPAREKNRRAAVIPRASVMENVHSGSVGLGEDLAATPGSRIGRGPRPLLR